MNRALQAVTWLRNAKRGERHEYFRGAMVKALESPLGHEPDEKKIDRKDIAGARRAMFQAHEIKQVVLVQKRHGPDDYSYLAVKT